MASFLARRMLLAVGVLAAVSFGSFTLIATKFSATCTSAYTPNTSFPPLASTAHQAAILYWNWVKSIPSGRSFGPVCGGGFLLPFWSAVGHTAVLLGLATILVVVFSLLIGTLAAVRSGSLLDVTFRGFSYLAWAVPSFVLALMLQSALGWAGAHYGFRTFSQSGWPGYCPSGLYLVNGTGCPPAGSGLHYVGGVLRHTTVPAIALALAFIGLHSRYLRSSLLVSLNAPYTTTAHAKGLSERRVVVRHALRNSLAIFTSVLLLDMGAIFGAAMAVDWVFHLNGLGTLFIDQINGVGGGDGPKFLDPYSIESLLAFAAFFVLGASLLAELAVGWLDPRARVR